MVDDRTMPDRKPVKRSQALVHANNRWSKMRLDLNYSEPQSIPDQFGRSTTGLAPKFSELTTSGTGRRDLHAGRRDIST